MNEYKPKKPFYADENDFIAEFCASKKCKGVENVGESGGENCYGCEEMEEALESAQKLDFFEERKAVEEIDKLQSENKKMRECIEFYADYESYINGCDYAGKRARQTLKELDKK